MKANNRKLKAAERMYAATLADIQRANAAERRDRDRIDADAVKDRERLDKERLLESMARVIRAVIEHGVAWPGEY